MQISSEGQGSPKEISPQTNEVTLGFSASQLIDRANFILSQPGLSIREQKGLTNLIRVCSEIQDGTEMDYLDAQVKAIRNGSQNPDDLAEFTHLPIICSDTALGQTLKIIGVVEAATGMAKPMVETHLQILPEIYANAAGHHTPILANYKGAGATDIRILIGEHPEELKLPTVFFISETSKTAQEFAFSRFEGLEKRRLITREKLSGELTAAQLKELREKVEDRHHVVFMEQSPDQVKSSLIDIANSSDRLDGIVLEKSYPYYPPELISWISEDVQYMADTFVKTGMYFAAGYDEANNAKNKLGIRFLLKSLRISGGVPTELGGLLALLKGVSADNQEKERSSLGKRYAVAKVSVSPLLAPFFSKEDLPGYFTLVAQSLRS